MGLVTHALVGLLGTGSWVAINGVWVELPLLVPSTPEGWLLPSCLTLALQLANVGPLLVTLAHRFRPGWLHEGATIYALLALGSLACLLLAFFWGQTSVVGSSRHSTALLALFFCLALVDCTSSVTFLPYMQRLQPPYLATYFAGEGLSGLLPGLVALGQGVGVVRCVNGSRGGNSTAGLLAEYQEARFSVSAFFLFLSAMMAFSLGAFAFLNHLLATQRARAKEGDQVPMESVGGQPESQDPAGGSFGSGTYSGSQMGYIFGLLGWVNALTNGVLPAVQSYSCLPYGDAAYHLSTALASLANPLACVLGMCLPSRSLVLMGALSFVGSLLACYIMAMAVLSPCPPLLHGPHGAILIVLCWVLFVGFLSYVKLMIGMVLRDKGHSALVWCGAVVQLGSMVGALTLFPLVSIYSLFHPGDPCNTSCPV
ncbi:riboflavin transporter 2-like isoform X2 [Rhineura floridana]|nr:riboflavin transporter 2-like isoform X2 [Rhineura floridana]XP_061463169.1 riboflavin transporter 2-like isoform X2 [Rhineura floridana]